MHIRQYAQNTGDLVLDIGTGTGLLAMLAARQMDKLEQNIKSEKNDTEENNSEENKKPSDGHVIGCEVYPPMANMARRIVRENGLAHKVTVVGKRSTDLHVGDGGSLMGDVYPRVHMHKHSHMHKHCLLPQTHR